MAKLAGMKTLSEYLSSRSKAEFAEAIGVSSSQLSQYLGGYRRPSYDRMLQIEAATGGEVPVQSWPRKQHVGATPSRQPRQPKRKAGVA